jgi:hypothetical protein
MTVNPATEIQSVSVNGTQSKKRQIEPTGKLSWHVKSPLKSFVHELLLLIALLLISTKRRRRKKSSELSPHLEWRITRRKASTMRPMQISYLTMFWRTLESCGDLAFRPSVETDLIQMLLF